MKISIWKQFSSNHSANFTTVGRFESEEKATVVANELRKMIQQISDWREKHPDFNSLAYEQNPETATLSPPELAIKDKYQVAWCTWESKNSEFEIPIDWIHNLASVDSVKQYQDLVWLEPLGNTWCGSHPFDHILKKLGGSVASANEDVSLLTVDIAFETPSLEIDSELQKQIRVIEREPHSHIVFPGFGNAVPGVLIVEGNDFQIKGLHLRWAGIKDDPFDCFMKVIRFLEAHQCAGITYTFHQIGIEEFYGK